MKRRAHKATMKKEIQMANENKQFRVCVCTYIMDASGVGLQSLQNAGNRLLILLQSFFILDIHLTSLFCYISESIQNIYG